MHTRVSLDALNNELSEANQLTIDQLKRSRSEWRVKGLSVESMNLAALVLKHYVHAYLMNIKAESGGTSKESAEWFLAATGAWTPVMANLLAAHKGTKQRGVLEAAIDRMYQELAPVIIGQERMGQVIGPLSSLQFPHAHVLVCNEATFYQWLESASEEAERFLCYTMRDGYHSEMTEWAVTRSGVFRMLLAPFTSGRYCWEIER